VDEKRLAAPVALAAGCLVSVDEPETNGNPGREEELTGQRDDAVDEVGLDYPTPDLAFASRVRRQRSVRHHETSAPVRREVVDDVLDPRVVRVLVGRLAVRPPCVAGYRGGA